MNLADRDQGPGQGLGSGARRDQKALAVALHVVAQVFRGEAEIEAPTAVGSTVAAWTSAECMDQPRNAFEVRGLKDLDFCPFCGTFGKSRHTAILNGRLQVCGVHKPLSAVGHIACDEPHALSCKNSLL